ncbi:MAG TPA: F0F1 ATP synthase subunit epsilon [Chromatiaceae bacterium]|nr:F0F1 ATP synthase subunit epsilon [Chromatiaceae bacterium]
MNRDFTLHLQSAARYERIAGLVSFVGEDASGSFGLLPGHAPFLTLLEYGLARFRQATGPWRYLACPGAVLWFTDDELFLNTRRYLIDEDYGRISGLLEGQLAEEEAALKSVKDNLQRLEQELFRRLRGLEAGRT